MENTSFDPSSALTLCFALALLANMVLKWWLASRNAKHVAAHRHAVPPAFVNQISLAAHQKAADYTVAKTQFGMLEFSWGAAVTVVWTLMGGLTYLNQQLNGVLPSGIAQQLGVLVAFVVINALIDLPFSLYGTFKLEAQFDFNRTTATLWLQDTFKSLILSAAIGLPLAALVLWMMAATGPLWWLWTWAFWMGFNLLAMFIYPTWIAPLFNQFKPLQDEALIERVNQLMQRCGFQAKGLFVMDGSKRSAHANAYFTGFGASKRVVFYDTLLQQLSPAEVDAVLAHELGHFSHRHIIKRMLVLFGVSLIGFVLLGYLSSQIWFYIGLGVIPNLSGDNHALALLLFMMVAPLLGSLLVPLMAYFSRKHEFEADAYAAEKTSGKDLSTALLKLYEDNASTLTPDPLYVKFYYSHPPASERLGRLGGLHESSSLGSLAATPH